MLLHDARREARVGGAGELVLLDDQDRARWDATRIEEGQALVEERWRMGRPGPYQVQAAIAVAPRRGAHPADTDWTEIAVALRRRSMRMTPVAGRGAQPGGGRGDGATARRSAWR